MSHARPICSISLEPQSRYPRYVCQPCASRARATMAARWPSRAKDSTVAMSPPLPTTASYDSHNCWIDGIACRADEARFGGIVIEVRV